MANEWFAFQSDSSGEFTVIARHAVAWVRLVSETQFIVGTLDGKTLSCQMTPEHREELAALGVLAR